MVARYVEQAREQLDIDPKERTLFLTPPIDPDTDSSPASKPKKP